MNVLKIIWLKMEEEKAYLGQLDVLLLILAICLTVLNTHMVLRHANPRFLFLCCTRCELCLGE